MKIIVVKESGDSNTSIGQIADDIENTYGVSVSMQDAEDDAPNNPEVLGSILRRSFSPLRVSGVRPAWDDPSTQPGGGRTESQR